MVSGEQLEYRIRDATIEDAEGMARASVEAWRFAFARFLPAEFIAKYLNVVARLARIRELWPTEAYRLVAVGPTDQVVGFASEHRPCSLAGFDAEIGGLYVHPSASRSGVGLRLVGEMAGRFVADGRRSMAIHTLADNEIGCAFYEKIRGQNGPDTTWQGFPSKWYIWPDLELSFGVPSER